MKLCKLSEEHFEDLLNLSPAKLGKKNFSHFPNFPLSPTKAPNPPLNRLKLRCLAKRLAQLSTLQCRCIISISEKKAERAIPSSSVFLARSLLPKAKRCALRFECQQIFFSLISVASTRFTSDYHFSAFPTNLNPRFIKSKRDKSVCTLASPWVDETFFLFLARIYGGTCVRVHIPGETRASMTSKMTTFSRALHTTSAMRNP